MKEDYKKRKRETNDQGEPGKDPKQPKSEQSSEVTQEEGGLPTSALAHDQSIAPKAEESKKRKHETEEEDPSDDVDKRVKSMRSSESTYEEIDLLALVLAGEWAAILSLVEQKKITPAMLEKQVKDGKYAGANVVWLLVHALALKKKTEEEADEEAEGGIDEEEADSDRIIIQIIEGLMDAGLMTAEVWGFAPAQGENEGKNVFWCLVNAYLVLEDDIQQMGRWLLPLELKLIAHAFNIRIHYHTAAQAKVEIFNPTATSAEVWFNGSDHFEREPAPWLKKKAEAAANKPGLFASGAKPFGEEEQIKKEPSASSSSSTSSSSPKTPGRGAG